MFQRVERYAFSVPLNVECQFERAIRPLRMYTQVDSSGLVTINGIWIGAFNELIQPVDAWFFSATYGREIHAQFLREHGLTNATDREIQRYIDINEISPPDPHRIHLRTIDSAVSFKVTGESKEPAVIAFVGLTPA